MAVIKNQPAKITNNIDLSITERQRFSINNDPNRAVFLNISDAGIVARVKEGYPKLMAIVDKVQKAMSNDDDSDEALDNLVKSLEVADKEMRELMDEIFDSKVSDACAPDGTMYDLFNGRFRFEIILESLVKLYTTNMDNEIDALKKKAEKYTKKYHK